MDTSLVTVIGQEIIDSAHCNQKPIDRNETKVQLKNDCIKHAAHWHSVTSSETRISISWCKTKKRRVSYESIREARNDRCKKHTGSTDYTQSQNLKPAFHFRTKPSRTQHSVKALARFLRPSVTQHRTVWTRKLAHAGWSRAHPDVKTPAQTPL